MNVNNANHFHNYSKKRDQMQRTQGLMVLAERHSISNFKMLCIHMKAILQHHIYFLLFYIGDPVFCKYCRD